MSEQKDTLSINKDIPISLHREFKAAAALRGLTMKAALIKAIENFNKQRLPNPHA